MGAPLAKRNAGRQRKLRIKGCLEGGRKKKGASNGGNEVSTALTNANGKKMIRGPMTCFRRGGEGHKQS